VRILMAVVMGVVLSAPAWAADSAADQAYKAKRTAAKALADGSAEKAQAFEALAEGEGRTQSEKNGSVSQEAANVEAWCWQNAGYQWLLVGDFEKSVKDYENALKCESIDPECKRLAEKDMATAKAKLTKEQKAEVVK